MVSVSLDGSARVWNVETGQERFSIREPDSTMSCAVSKSGDLVAIGTSALRVLLYDGASGDKLGTIELDPGTPWCLCFDNEESQLAVGSTSGQITLKWPSRGLMRRGFGDTRFFAFGPVNKALEIDVMLSIHDRFRVFGGISSLHEGGAHVCFADGSVRFLPENLDSWDLTNAQIDQIINTNTTSAQFGILQMLSTRNGQEVVGEF